jgi:Glycyl-tRNA synthetase, beta subunit
LSEYLLEIGSGELPYEEVRQIPPAFKNIVENFLLNELFLAEKPLIETCATPRRTVLFIKELPAKSPDREIEIIGPPVNISYHGGVPAEPLLQFMKKTGIPTIRKSIRLIKKRGFTPHAKRK